MYENRAVVLYRNILREHRLKLPSQMRALGDDYVRNEFKLHKKATAKSQIDQFFIAWEDYLIQMKASKGRYGKNMNEPEKAKLSKEQLEKLKELRGNLEE